MICRLRIRSVRVDRGRGQGNEKAIFSQIAVGERDFVVRRLVNATLYACPIVAQAFFTTIGHKYKLLSSFRRQPIDGEILYRRTSLALLELAYLCMAQIQRNVLHGVCQILQVDITSV